MTRPGRHSLGGRASARCLPAAIRRAQTGCAQTPSRSRSGYGLLNAAKSLSEAPARWSNALTWNGAYPSTQQVRTLQEILFALTGAGTAVKTPAQLGARLNMLRFSRGNARALVDNQLQNFHNDPDEAVEDTLEFIRNWAQFKIPTALTTLGSLAADVLGQTGMSITDPTVFAGELENLFLPPFAAVLEEYGLPVALTTKIEDQLDLRHAQTLDDVLGRLRAMPSAPADLSPFEREMFDDSRVGL
jgi:hypothetical protein